MEKSQLRKKRPWDRLCSFPCRGFPQAAPKRRHDQQRSSTSPQRLHFLCTLSNSIRSVFILKEYSLRRVNMHKFVTRSGWMGGSQGTIPNIGNAEDFREQIDHRKKFVCEYRTITWLKVSYTVTCGSDHRKLKHRVRRRSSSLSFAISLLASLRENSLGITTSRLAKAFHLVILNYQSLFCESECSHTWEQLLVIVLKGQTRDEFSTNSIIGFCEFTASIWHRSIWRGLEFLRMITWEHSDRIVWNNRILRMITWEHCGRLVWNNRILRMITWEHSDRIMWNNSCSVNKL